MEPLNKVIREAFSRWEGNENGFSKDVLVPLLIKIGFKGVKFTGGPEEKGIDVVYYETSLPEELPRFTGIQTKTVNITATVKGVINPSGLESQIKQAFEKEVGLEGEDPYTRISNLVICTTGEITKEARKEIQTGIYGDRRLGAPIRFWDGTYLTSFIERYWLQEFARIAEIEVPEPILIVGDQSHFSIAKALSDTGNYHASIPYYIESLRLSAMFLASVYLETGNIDLMLKTAKTAIDYDTDHYNQFWLAGFAEFILQHLESARSLLEKAVQILEADKSTMVQRGPGFQERYLQAIGLLLEIARKNDEKEKCDKLLAQYKIKYKFLREELGSKPTPLGDWEKVLQVQLDKS